MATFNAAESAAADAADGAVDAAAVPAAAADAVPAAAADAADGAVSAAVPAAVADAVPAAVPAAVADAVPVSVMNKTGGGVIAAGSYGCIFRPHLSCKTGKEVKNSKYVSKLMIDKEWRINREIAISNKIMSIPNYSDYFSPILETCSLSSIKNIKKEDIIKCKPLEKKSSKEISKLAKIKYINGSDLLTVFTKSNSVNNYTILLTIYEQGLECIELLIKEKLVHFDLHSKNIMFNETLLKTIFIDFGLTFDISKLKNYNQLSRIFFAPDSYDYTLWPIEIHYITFLIWNKDKMDNVELNRLIEEYVENHSLFKKNNKRIIKDEYIKKAKITLTKINKLERNKAILYVIKHAWKTWDNYSLSLEMSLFLYELNDNNDEIKKLLYVNLSPNFKERMSITETKLLFKNIKKNISSKNLLSQSADINQIKKNLTFQTKKTLKIKKKIIKKYFYN